MLVLSRKQDQEIRVDYGADAIRVVVVAIEGNRVRLGIEAPDGVLIVRGELIPDTVFLEESR